MQAPNSRFLFQKRQVRQPPPAEALHVPRPNFSKSKIHKRTSYRRFTHPQTWSFHPKTSTPLSRLTCTVRLTIKLSGHVGTRSSIYFSLASSCLPISLEVEREGRGLTLLSPVNPFILTCALYQSPYSSPPLFLPSRGVDARSWLTRLSLRALLTELVRLVRARWDICCGRCGVREDSRGVLVVEFVRES